MSGKGNQDKYLGTQEEREIAQKYFSEAANVDVCESIKSVKVVGVKKIDNNITILTFPYKDINNVLKCSATLINNLEKKYNGHVFIVGQYRAFPVVPVSGRRYKPFRPSKRTLTFVNESYLKDLVYSYNITSKTTNYNHKGKQLTTIRLANLTSLSEDRLKSLGKVYNRLTGLNVEFTKAPAAKQQSK